VPGIGGRNIAANENCIVQRKASVRDVSNISGIAGLMGRRVESRISISGYLRAAKMKARIPSVRDMRGRPNLKLPGFRREVGRHRGAVE
jgi:hypothetical protein